MAVTVRPAAPHEAAAVAALAAATFPLACPPGTPAADIDAFVAGHLDAGSFAGHLADPHRTILVAHAGPVAHPDADVGGRDAGPASGPDTGPGANAHADPDAGPGPDAGGLVGYAMVVHRPPDDPGVAAAETGRPTASLDKFYVHPDHHGTGVAAALMAGVVEAAGAGGARSVWLGVNVANHRAIRFYAGQGFVEVGTRRFRLGTRLEHDLVLERTLAGVRA